MRRFLLVATSAALGALLAVAPASAAFGLNGFDVAFTGPNGSAMLQAGSHPFEMTVSFNVNTKASKGGVLLDDALKDLELTQMPGFVGNPTAVPPCATSDFLTPVEVESLKAPNCPNSAAVGVVGVETIANEKAGGVAAYSAVYNLEPPPGLPAKLGFWTGGVPVTIELGVSETPPFNIVGGPRNVSQILEILTSRFTIWGVPASPAHDSMRGKCVKSTGGSSGICEADISEKPFLTLPRACAGPLATPYRAFSWQSPGEFVEGGALTHDSSGNPRGMSGCGQLEFAPETSARPSARSAESSSGLDFTIDVLDEGLANPDGLAQADIAKVVAALPEGMTVNPSAAEGLGVCTITQYEAERLGTAPGQGCPEASKLGSIEAETPLLENHTLRGAVFIAAQDDPATTALGAENPLDSPWALYLVVRDLQLGIFVKMPAKLELNPRSGQLTTTVEDLPPFPLGHVNVHLHSGPRAPLVTPPACGAYTTTAILTPSSGAAPLPTSSTFRIDTGVEGRPCPSSSVPPFAPTFSAGSLNNAAGAFSPFSMRLARADGDQEMTRFSAILPPGLTGKIAGVAKCTDAAIAAAKAKSGREEQAAPSCPGSSRIGRVLGGVGVGVALTYVPGTLYLAGPFGGDSLSVVAIVPAVAGPFDVGTVVTRTALQVNPHTAEVEVDGEHSDPIPHILEGVPLRVRDIRVYADRSRFTLNPTNCTPTSSRALLFGGFADIFDPADDVPVALRSRYQAASCASLAFKPKLTLRLKGGTRRSDHPALRAVLTPRPGDANIGRSVVTLPPSEIIENAHIKAPCTRVQFNAGRCPKGSLLGTARAFTPLLDEPLEGPVYFRSNGGEHPLPDIVADLGGLFRIILVGNVDAKNARIRTTFASPPDAPVTKFVLSLKGGKEGLLVNSRNLCGQKLRANADFTGQNGRVHRTRPVVAVACSKAKKGQKHRVISIK
jgi:hypothetical protein